MQNNTPRRSKPELGKWALWKFFAAVSSIRPHLPPTAIFNKTSLSLFLAKYGSVYIKPIPGQQGKGIVKAWKKGNRYWFVKERGQAVSSPSVDDLYHKIKATGLNVSYIVQKSIDLAEIGGRPFDVRLMMMLDKPRQWKYIGMVAKVAGPSSVITNVARGRGYVLEVDEAIRRSLGANHEKIESIKKQMIQLGYKVCRRFDDYKKYWQIGLDLAVDKQGRVWVIEENTGPAHSLFYKLKDKSTFRKIKQIAALYPRRRKRKFP